MPPNASLCILMGKLWSVLLAFNYEAALTPSRNFSQELSKDQTTTYIVSEAKVNVLCVTLVFSGVKFGQLVTI